VTATPEEIALLEQLGHDTWPALEQEMVHGWLAKAAQGVTRRSNSINPAGPPSSSLVEAVEAGRTWLLDRGLPPIFRVTSLAPSDLEPLLQQSGLTKADGAVIMTRTLPPEAPTTATVTIGSRRSEVWSDVLAGQGDRGGPARQVVSRLLDSHTLPAGYAIARNDEEVVAIGMTVIAGDHAGIFNMRTAPEHRRKGHAGAILEALMAHGRAAGATTAFIQVAPANRPAVELYTAAGFTERYRYWYYS